MVRTHFVAERHKITKSIDRPVAQTKISRASTVSLIDLINIQFLNFGCNKSTKSHKGVTK